MQLMSIEDLAVYLGDSKRTIYKYIADGDCPPYIRISSKNIKFDRADVDAWLESKKVHPVSGENKMNDISLLNSAKVIIKNAISTYKLPWMPRAQAALKQAEKLAQKDSVNFIGSKHILLGIISVEDCIAAKVLENLGADSFTIHQQCEHLCKSTKKMNMGETKFSEDIDKVINCAYEQATQWTHTYIGTEHLLAGILLAGKGAGYQILNDLSITIDKVREETAKLIVCKNTQTERKEK